MQNHNILSSTIYEGRDELRCQKIGDMMGDERWVETISCAGKPMQQVMIGVVIIASVEVGWGDDPGS